jgi:hypothetical protein
MSRSSAPTLHPSFSALRSLAAALSLVLVGAVPAAGYDASVAWQPVADADGYKIYVRYDAQAFGAPTDVGALSPESDGAIRVVVADLPLGPTASFAVSAYNSEGIEGARSNERSIVYAAAAAVYDSDGDGLTDAREDLDLDGIVDSGETDPFDPDSDDDSLSDGKEIDLYGTDPLDSDSDDDGLADGIEVGVFGTDPTKADTDGDGVSDGDEVADGTDPIIPNEGVCTDVPSGGGCDDGDVCTTDVCTQDGCEYTAHTAGCDDGIACTVSDSCASGVCAGVDGCGSGLACNFNSGECDADFSQVWIPAASYPDAEFMGAMTVGSRFALGSDDDPSADSLMPALVYPNSNDSSLSAGSGDEVVYTIVLPTAGEWFVWGRFYYGGELANNDANSFFLRVDDGDVRQFGNNRVYSEWHWDGAGWYNSDSPEPYPLGYLEAGFHRITVEKRETQTEPPRLDAIFLTMDREDVPSDAAASAAMCPDGDCGNEIGAQCGDATGDGRITAADAWVVLAAAVDLGNFCRAPVCDVDADGSITSSDAMRVLEYSVSGGDVIPLVCTGDIEFYVDDASGLSEITLELDYSASQIGFSDEGGEVVCTSDLAGNGASIVHIDDAAAGILDLSIRLDQPVTGTARFASCRYEARGTRVAVPDLSSIVVDVLEHDDADGDLELSVHPSF